MKKLLKYIFYVVILAITAISVYVLYEGGVLHKKVVCNKQEFKKALDDMGFLNYMMNTSGIQVCDKLKKDKKFFLDMVKKDTYAFESADDSLKKDKKFVLSIIEENYKALYFADDSLRKDKKIILDIVKNNGRALEGADDTLKKDKDVVLVAVKQDGFALQYADDTLKKDKDVLLAAANQINGCGLKWLQFDDFLTKKKFFVQEIVKRCGEDLEYVDAILKKDKDVVLAAVKSNPFALEYADASLKKDKDVVLAAVRQDGFALQYADDTLKKDKDVVLTAIKHNPYALQYADDTLKKNKNIVMLAVEKDNHAIKYVDDTLKQDKDVLMIASGHHPLLSIIDDAHKKNKNFVLAAVSISGHNLEYANASLKKDKKFVLAAVKENSHVLEYADASLKKDKDVVLTAVKEKGNMLQYADASLKKDKDVVLTAIKSNPFALEYADASLKKDKKFVLAAVKENSHVLEYADASLKKDIDVVLAAIQNNNIAFKYMDESLMEDNDFVRKAIPLIAKKSYKMKNVYGKEITIVNTQKGLYVKQYPKKIIIIDFNVYSDDSPLFKFAIDNLKQIEKKFKGNVQIIGINSWNSNKVQDVSKWVSKNKVSYPVVAYEDALAFIYSMLIRSRWTGSTPYEMLFDQNGTYIGSFLAMDIPKKLKNIVQKLIDGTYGNEQKLFELILSFLKLNDLDTEKYREASKKLAEKLIEKYGKEKAEKKIKLLMTKKPVLIVKMIEGMMDNKNKTPSKKSADKCQKEIQKDNINIENLKKVCTEAGKYYENKEKYDYASWFYLLGGNYRYNISDIKNHIPISENVSNIAHSYMLLGDLKNAKKYYKFYLERDYDLDEDFEILNKIYHSKKDLISKGKEIWKTLKEEKKNIHTDNNVKKQKTSPSSKTKTTQCDLLAGSPMDPHFKGIEYDKIKVFKALDVCKKELVKNPKNARTLFELGRIYDRAGEYEKANTYFKKSCESGYVLGCYSIGINYRHGDGVPKDIEKTLTYFTTACDGGIAPACNSIGFILEKRKEYENAAKYYTKACDLKNAMGCANLGGLHLKKLIRNANDIEARKLFKKGCSLGNKKACDSIKLVAVSEVISDLKHIEKDIDKHLNPALFQNKEIATVVGLDPKGDNFLAVRNKPRGKQIGKLYSHEKVEILEKRGKWYKIKRVDGELSGWSFSAYLSIKNPNENDQIHVLHKIDVSQDKKDLIDRKCIIPRGTYIRKKKDEMEVALMATQMNGGNEKTWKGVNLIDGLKLNQDYIGVIKKCFTAGGTLFCQISIGSEQSIFARKKDLHIGAKLY